MTRARARALRLLDLRVTVSRCAVEVVLGNRRVGAEAALPRREPIIAPGRRTSATFLDIGDSTEEQGDEQPRHGQRHRP